LGKCLLIKNVQLFDIMIFISLDYEKLKFLEKGTYAHFVTCMYMYWLCDTIQI
jgi:hypothetical protein